MTSSTRRSFLTASGGSLILAHWLRSAVARAQGAAAPKRFMMIHRPNGSIPEDFTRNGAPGPILEPFMPVWANAVCVKGVHVRSSNGVFDHEGGMLTIMTGAPVGRTQRTNDDYLSSAESLDQTLLKASPLLSKAPVKSLQLGAHGRQDGGNETPNVNMSYSGAGSPLSPNLGIDDVYKRLFSNLMPGPVTPASQEALTRARARKASVLDFLSWDLSRVRKQFPASSKGDLDTHEGAIREMEQSLDRGGGAVAASGCGKPMIKTDLKANGDVNNMAEVGAQHLAMVTAAFACDLTRVVTFQWATGASLVAHPLSGVNNHHSVSHANSRGPLSSVDKWFSQKTVPFIQSLIATPDVGGGKLIDNTLVWYFSEVSEGYNHSHNNHNFLLFGGDGVNLKNRGRILDVAGQRTSNDLWSALAPSFGATLGGFKTKAMGPIPGLFADT